ncbi:MAG: ABC transporter ATP-binding protein, partial [Candidatus Woesebacteria bacterium]|nr:ABC transporter ATP-binding protein [Candidatus Woesebacteria bacterium]
MPIKVRQILRVFLRHVRPYWRSSTFLLAALVAGQIVGLLPPLFYKKFFDTLAQGAGSGASDGVLVGILLVIFGLHFGNWLIFRIFFRLMANLESRVMANLERTSFAYLLGHSYEFFTNNFAGSLVRKVRRFSRSFEDLTDNVAFNVLPLLITVVVVVLGLWSRSALIAELTLAWAVITIFANWLVSRWKLKFDQARATVDSEVTGVIADALTNITTIQSFTGEAREREIFREVSERQRKATLKSWRLSEIHDAIQWGLVIIIEFLVMYYAVRLWEKGLLTIGDFALFQGYLITLFERMWNVGRAIRRMYESLADATEMVEILETPHEVRDALRAKPIAIARGGIEFQNITFRYRSTRVVLKNFNLKIKPREKIAFVGPSGAGKTTIAKILFRYYDLDRGKILIDGQNTARATAESLRAAIALVPQEPILFHRSLMENMRYGRKEATDEEVIAAAKKARAHEFIKTLPDGYATLVGERGIKLSGGERQRVAITRAILKNAPSLVLDEATSSLASESDSLIQAALEELMG